MVIGSSRCFWSSRSPLFDSWVDLRWDVLCGGSKERVLPEYCCYIPARGARPVRMELREPYQSESAPGCQDAFPQCRFLQSMIAVVAADDISAQVKEMSAMWK